ncbi:MAG: DUF4344 domain-containing metallopeptidase [Shimia sp.]|uniref:DUF4344 domain-containing metallopeptidase n=1 Tax=Shimia sp. TaxID=1954381 RepID=UPI0040594E26
MAAFLHFGLWEQHPSPPVTSRFCWLSTCRAQANVNFDRIDDAILAYVGSNLLGIFYQQLGHALIDILVRPIFGQEEDVADMLSIFLRFHGSKLVALN